MARALAHARRSARRAADAAARLSGAVLRHRQAAASRKRWKCSRIFSAAAPTAGSTARWWWTSSVAVSGGRLLRQLRARHVEIRRLRLAAPGRHAAAARGGRSTRVIAEVIDKGVTAEELERAKTRLIADAVYAQDNQASMARWYGAALTTGATVKDVRRWPDRIRAVTAGAGAGRRPPMARQAALGHRLSDQGREPAGGEAIMSRLVGRCSRSPRSRCWRRAPAASAMKIEKIVSPSGIEAWLVREQTVPLVALNYAFHGGSSQDEADKSGTANLAADLLDEGAGDLDGKTFHERLENHAIELDFPGRARLFPRLAAHAQRAPRRGVRSAAAGADRAALRRRRGRARARAGAASLRREPPIPTSRQSPLVGRPRSPAILTAARARARWRPCRASPPTICAIMCAASSRATS